MQAALREFLPLHLGLTFRFRWLTWDELDHLRGTFPVTWDQLDTLNDGGPYTWDDFERLRPFGDRRCQHLRRPDHAAHRRRLA
jgi:hypothetical protein